ncbi:unnamed protein product [Closterium sp. NIES-64]|nr:unnamed protein product [Closterium sp. NIES-65]CAI5999719.1 unnamed protein product [Closterium sp. NIES-64]
MSVKQRTGGSFMAGCSSFPLCREAVWMPSSLVEATLSDSHCPNCRPGPLSCLNLRFRRSEIPPQFDPVQQAGEGGAVREV